MEGHLTSLHVHDTLNPTNALIPRLRVRDRSGHSRAHGAARWSTAACLLGACRSEGPYAYAICTQKAGNLVMRQCVNRTIYFDGMARVSLQERMGGRWGVGRRGWTKEALSQTGLKQSFEPSGTSGGRGGLTCPKVMLKKHTRSKTQQKINRTQGP